MIITGKKFSKPAMSRVINGDVQLSAAPEKPEKFRLDHLLLEQHPEFSRSVLQGLIKSGRVTVDGQITKKPNTGIERTQTIELHLPDRVKIERERPRTIYEDDQVLVLDKPAGLLSMKKGDFTDETTLEDYGLLVHRLDRDTSGVVILAKDEATQTFLRKQFQDRKAHKTYFAVVEGRPKLDAALIDLPIERNYKHPTTFVVGPAGKPSQTNYRVVRTTGDRSLLELKPTTGRTHQLRVHLKYLGCPILGDRVYGSAPKDFDPTAPRDPADRLYLHAASLELTLPGGTRRTFESPLPEEFERVLR